MSSCEGRGDCIQQCFCICYEDEEGEIPLAACTCGHRDHIKLNGGTSGYCKSECKYNCELIKCPNYKFCGVKYPQCILDCHGGKCLNCAMFRISFVEKNSQCEICSNTKDILKCENHTICMKCCSDYFNNLRDEMLDNEEEGDGEQDNED